MSDKATSPAFDFAAASRWFAAASAEVRATVNRHLQHHKLMPKEGDALSSPSQIAMIEKALGEHHAVLLPAFRRACGATGLAAAPAAQHGYLARKLLGEDEAFLRTHTGVVVQSLDASLGYATLALPATLTTHEAALAYARSLFASRTAAVSPAATHGHFTLTLPVYDLKRDIDRIRKPVGFRALPTRSADERLAMEEEFRVLMGQDAPPKQKEMEALVQDVGMKKALEELTKDYRLMFHQNLHQGVYAFPVANASSLLVRGAEALLAAGTLSANDVAISHGQLHITPHALNLLEEALFHGVQGKGYVQVPALLSDSAVKTRQEYFAKRDSAEALRDVVKQQLNRLTDSERTEVEAILAREKTMPQGSALVAVSQAVEHSLAARDATRAVGSPTLNQAAMRRAVAHAHAVLSEDKLWQHLTDSQLASGHNTIREDHREALGILDGLLAEQTFSQTGLQALIAMPRFADAIRDSGHFLHVVATPPKGSNTASKSAQVYSDAAKHYARAFNLPEASLIPTSSEAKSASYHLRAMSGHIGWGEFIASNIFMGLKPIFSSVELAVKKPVLCGATIVGIAAYSGMVPKKYSIPQMLNNMMHKIIEGLGIPHGHDSEGAKKMMKLAEAAVDDIKQSGAAGDSFWKGFRTGRKFGVGQTAAVGASAFVLFNLVEDVIVHLPLALVSVGVGAAGGATGRKVLSPVFNDLGDIAGKLAPEPVREAWRADMKVLKATADQPWLQRISQDAKTLAHDVDEFGIIITARHAVSSATSGVQSLLGRVLGAPQPVAAPQKMAAR